MPYFLRGKCVWKGTKDNPIEQIKCHETREKALAHLAALYVNVEDVQEQKEHTCVCPECGHVQEAPLGQKCRELECSECGARMRQETPGVEPVAKEALGLLYTYKDDISDRWVAVSTVQTVDKQNETFTTTAMDKGIARAQRLKEYPELRLWHVRGFKLGMCDYMSRVGIYAVDQGYWHQTPFAQAMKDLVVANDGRWRVSRGFFPVKAAGQCTSCGTDLSVGPWNFMLGVRCGVCGSYYAKPRMLKDLRHLETVTFDITLTDVPAVADTAVTAYTLSELG